jgi:hypothetical protein
MSNYWIAIISWTATVSVVVIAVVVFLLWWRRRKDGEGPF